ncbi:hypothetical protein JTE90_024677 [Oedothorax gibbosus]|uniref:Uncharacterized protein n=1 Tax=Oedothorax gibbosus TaxID=931172 RepID=A0AAV6TIF5_9ARAC|nr:hypothetical protein JTE90_024677 [Oedothorax gibbosus]
MPSSDCLEQPTPFMGSHERLASDALTGRLVHPTAPVLLTKSGPLGTLILSRPAFSHARRTSHPFKTRSDDRFATSEPLRTSTRVSSGLVLSGHSSPSFGSQRVRSNSATSTSGTRRVSGAPRPRGNGDPECGPTSAGLYFHFAAGLIQDPLTRAHVRLLGPCFKTGRVEFTTRLRLHFQATRLQGDRIRIEPSSYGPRTTLGTARSRGLAAESVSGTLTPKATFPHALASGGFGLGFSRFTRRY